MTPSLPTFFPAIQLPLAIDNSQLVLQDMLGVGAYGSVYRAIDTQTLQNYAVKSLNKAGLDSHQRAFQNHEAQLHAQVSGHPNIATLHKVIEENDCLHMVLDCGMEGDLFYAITERGGYVGNTVAIKAIFSQIANAVLHCHSRGVYHRDLKPENIIMFGHSVKLVDFGLATTEPTSSDFGCGSTFYLSPECQGGYIESVISYDSAANDVWSLGVILINLVFGRNPWKQACPRDETFSAYVQNNDFLLTILPISAELNEIVKGVFCLNPKKRITLPELARRVQACGLFTAPEFLTSNLHRPDDKEDSGVDLLSMT
ncbi:hypothetical protein BGZ96_008304 [Linnemannia gamsii]|uniref:Protein kinase domain-containing protein n=1 Tax=Linnemannia gamsii TaxID=64522 RepID=A0ABQ7K0T2_9FUNG|nr:hypothetical protein BGZ96_008304 [Linnemannia gamsii]